MGRRRNHDFWLVRAFHRIFVEVPWWLGLLSVVFIYVIAMRGLPEQSPHQPLAMIARFAVRVVLLIIAVAWLTALVAKLRRRTLLNRQDCIADCRSLSWQNFERLVGESYRREGYTVEERGGARADGGTDLVVYKGGKRTLIQCKHWRSRLVGVAPVREIFGVMNSEKADACIVVCSGTFSKDAQTFAAGKPITLIDGNKLWQRIESVKGGRNFPASANARDAEAFAVSRIGAVPDCPLCSAEMVLRTARRGMNSGNQFWGCKQYPKCKGTRDFTAA